MKRSISRSTQPSVGEVFGTLLRNKTYCHLLLCYSVMIFFGSGGAQWLAVFFIRSYGLKTGEIGTWFAAVGSLGNLLGIYGGGLLTFRRAANNERLQLVAMAILYCIFTLIHAGMFLTHNVYLAFGLMWLGAIATGAILGPLYSIIQTLVPEKMRATSVAVLYLLSNLVGMGLGPLVAGMLSDALRPVAGNESLRYSLLALCPGYLWVAWHFWRASRTVTQDLKTVVFTQKAIAEAVQIGEGFQNTLI